MDREMAKVFRVEADRMGKGSTKVDYRNGYLQAVEIRVI